MTEKLKLVSESEAKLRKIHQQLWDIVNEHLGPEDPNAVMMLSGAMLKVCLELYTVVLQDQDIENLLDVFRKETNENIVYKATQNKDIDALHQTIHKSGIFFNRRKIQKIEFPVTEGSNPALKDEISLYQQILL
mgnify:CR=1 FL=1